MSFFYRMPKRPEKSETILVTDDEFILFWTENGGSEAKGRWQLEIAKRLGSSVAIGDRFYQPKVDPTID